MLRANLERERGSSWASGLIGLALPAAGVGKGVLVMTVKTKVAAAAAILLGAWFVIHELTALPERESDPRTGSIEAPTLAGGSSDPALPLVVDAPGGSRSSNPASIAMAPAAPDDRPPTLFYGSLRDQSGKVLAGLWSEGVGLTDSTGRWRSADAADGNFAFGALPYGKYWVMASADAYRQVEDVIELDSEHAQIKRDFTLPNAVELRVRVVSTDGETWFVRQRGTLIPGYPTLSPSAVKDRPGRWFKKPPFGSGHFTDYGPRVDALPPGYLGILTLDEELPAFVILVSQDLVLQTKEVKAGETEVEFVVSLDELRQLIPEAHVRVVDADSQAPIIADSLQVGPYCQLKPAGPSGEIVLKHFGAGDFDWEIHAPGYERRFVHFHAEPGSTVDLGTITLEKELRAEVLVIDSSGAPCSARIDVCSLDPATHEVALESRGIRSTGDGRLRLEGLGRRLYLLRSDEFQLIGDRVTTDSMLASGNVFLDLRSGSAPANLVIRLQPVTRLTLVVPDLSLKGMQLRVLDERGIAIYSNIVYGLQPRSLALPQGSYRIEVLDAMNRPLIEKSVTLGAGAISLELTR
jgi:hypothetical protein